MKNRTTYFESIFSQLLICSLLLLSWIFSAKGAELTMTADQLLMITSTGCPYCEVFESEVGNSYALTQEAKILPLTRHDFFANFPAYMGHIKPATMTPTFIIIKDGNEVGRIVGYSDQDLFWWQLSEFIGD